MSTALRSWPLLALLGFVLTGSDARANCLQPGEPPSEIAIDTCLETTSGDTPWQYIGTYTGTLESCPTAIHWTSARLFGANDTLPPGLNPFCLYTAADADADVKTLSALLCEQDAPDDACLNLLQPDRLVVSQQTDQAVEALLWSDFNNHFLDQSGAPGMVVPGGANARLAVIDTEPTGLAQELDGPGVSDHGFGLLNLARDMVCAQNGGCNAQLHSTIGLPMQRCSNTPGAPCDCANPEPAITGYCTTPLAGGHMGTQGQLARAVYAEMFDHETSGPSRIVINLSVGWDPRYGGQPPIASAPLGVQSVHAALEYASCRGALIIAAAGNQTTGPDSTVGPLLPGGWETEAAPTSNECDALLGSLPTDPSLFPTPPGVYRPLLYAVGALDHTDAAIRLRPQGEPRLAAFGDHAVAGHTVNMVEESAGFLTGTSVSSLVVSATAAAAWHLRPAQPSYAIMAALYGTAAPLDGRSADFCLDDGTGCSNFPVRRVNACEGINAVCAQFAGSPCPAFTCPSELPTIPALDLNALNATFAAAPVVDLSTYDNEARIVECNDDYSIRWDATAPQPVNPCPHLQFYGVQVTPWTDGQPSGEACEVCSNQFSSPGNFYLEIDQALLDPVRDVTLLCNGEGWHVADMMMPGDALKVIQIPEYCEPSDIDVSFRIQNGSSHQASVLSPSLKASDLDDDQVQDGADNCVLTPNPGQADSDGDGIGNACDADFNNDCVVNVVDLGFMRSVFFTLNPNADLNGDGIVNVVDLGILRQRFFAQPGPSGIPNVCN